MVDHTIGNTDPKINEYEAGKESGALNINPSVSHQPEDRKIKVQKISPINFKQTKSPRISDNLGQYLQNSARVEKNIMVQKKPFGYGTIELGQGDTNLARFMEESLGMNPNDILYNESSQRNMFEL